MILPGVEKKEDLKNINQSIDRKVMVEETWTVWTYDCILMMWSNSGLAE